MENEHLKHTINISIIPCKECKSGKLHIINCYYAAGNIKLKIVENSECLVDQKSAESHFSSPLFGVCCNPSSPFKPRPELGVIMSNTRKDISSPAPDADPRFVGPRCYKAPKFGININKYLTPDTAHTAL